MRSNGDRAPLVWTDAVGLIVGIIIGAGIFVTPGQVSAACTSPIMVYGLWIGGAVVALCGALCYAELAAAYPTDAGEAEYFTRAFGPFAGWYFTWIQLVCFRTAAAIVGIAYVFCDYAVELWPAPKWLLVVGSIIVLTCVNALGLRPGKWTQNTLAVCKLLGLSLILYAGFRITPSIESELLPSSAIQPLGLAVVGVMYAYSGWHEAAYIVGELRSPGRSLPRAMIVGVALVSVVYMAVNIAAIHGLGLAGLQTSQKFGVELMNRAGIPANRLALLAVIVTLGSINGTILSGSRLFGAVGSMQPGYGFLARWRTQRDAPLAALGVQAAICLAFVAVIEVFGSGKDGFNAILGATSPVLWIVFLGAGVALFVLRRREPDQERPYRVPFYPFVPSIYLIACVFMLYQSTLYALSQRGAELWLTLGLLGIGVPYWLLIRYCMAARSARARSSP